MKLEVRFEKAQIVRDNYPEFVDFCEDVMRFLGYSLTWMQRDICHYMQYGGQKLCVQAQRGEAKSTIACIFAVWRVVQDPTSRVLLISGSADKAEENGNLIQGIFKHFEILDYLLPDRLAGDRDSVKAYDVHWALKGVNKSPTVRCMGITASLQGYRADLLIPDDIETNKNSLTPNMREQLLNLSKEFSSIVADSDGTILYLGTPQTKDSLYAGLPGRGFGIRIWPGRFPSQRQVEQYGEALAPSILERINLLGPKCQTGKGIDGTRGWVTDPERIDEDEHLEKEIDQGPETYELQFMLNTELSDAMRQQLRLRDLVHIEASQDAVPEVVGWVAAAQFRKETPGDYPVPSAELYGPASISGATQAVQNVTLCVDPAGQGGDEVAFAVGGAVGPYLHLLAAGGFQGGMTAENMQKLVQVVKEFGCIRVVVEDNMGHGAATALLVNHFASVDPETGKRRLEGVGVEGQYVTGQKERRIIDLVRPVMQRHRLIVHQSALQWDKDTLVQYSGAKRPERSLWYQLHNLTTDRGSLVADDRVDVLSLLVKQFVQHLSIDEDREERRRTRERQEAFINNPMDRVGVAPKAASRGHRELPKRIRARRGHITA